MPHTTSPPVPVRPRDAASLLIYRHTGSEIQVLMGKRRPGARFLPDVYVFPGGALDAADALGAMVAQSEPEAQAQVQVQVQVQAQAQAQTQIKGQGKVKRN